MAPVPMSPRFRVFLQRWVVNTLAVLLAASVLPGINYDRPIDLVAASLLLGILNAVVRPVLMFLALPLVISTLGLFILVINALLLYFVGFVVRGFHVADFWSAFWGAVIIGIVSLIMNTLTGTGSTRIKVHRGKRPPGDGGGPVIDV